MPFKNKPELNKENTAPHQISGEKRGSLGITPLACLKLTQ